MLRDIDYLSGNWTEEEVLTLWKHIISDRREYDIDVRLENASWRMWIKIKDELRPIPRYSIK